MAVDMFIKIGDIKGESVDSKHKDEIDVLAWSWGASQSGTTHMGPGGGAGKVNVQDLSITKYVDRSTPTLMGYCYKGTHIAKTTLTVRKAGDKPLEYIVINMEDAIITAITTGGSGGEDRFTENISINFAKVSVDYTPQKKDGSGDAKVPFAYDIAANAKS
jgi:type VI secretion system secreted protein Hcp